MGKLMTLKEFEELVNYINENHGFWVLTKESSKQIKYIEPFYDTRSQKIHFVRFTLQGGISKEFKILNENRDKNLKEWIYSWLRSEIDG
jgi:hypothetical protein